MNIWLLIIAWFGLIAAPAFMFRGALLLPESTKTPGEKFRLKVVWWLLPLGLGGGMVSSIALQVHYGSSSLLHGAYLFVVLLGAFLTGGMVNATRARKRQEQEPNDSSPTA